MAVKVQTDQERKAAEFKLKGEAMRRGADPKEVAERLDAAKRYAGESESHFVDYAHDAIAQSMEATRPIRQEQKDLYDVWQEKEPANYTKKESWQSRVVVPKPFVSVIFGAASVEKAFAPEFLGINDASDTKAAGFWKKVMTEVLGETRARFVVRFSDAAIMSIAVGVSMEIIPRWEVNRGLVFELVEPWKILRDPYAPPRDPWGGMYWIHQEWHDTWWLLDQQRKGLFQNVEASWNVSGVVEDDPFMTREAIAARRDQLWDGGSRFRKQVQVSEYWGTVLSPSGEKLLDNAYFVVAGGRMIKPPEVSPYSEMRWPGIYFSPLPHLLRAGGRGFLQGVRSVWESMNNLMCMHEDAMNWTINPPTEINVDALVDAEDVLIWPGKHMLAKDTYNGQQAIRTVRRPDVTGSVLAHNQYYEGLFEAGSMVSGTVQGLPGYRQRVTWREKQQNLNQAQAPYQMVGKNFDEGATNVLWASYQVVRSRAGYADYADYVGSDLLDEHGVGADDQGHALNVPYLSGKFHVSGMSSLMKDADAMRTLVELVIPLSEKPGYSPLINKGAVLRAIERRSGLSDEGIFIPKADSESFDRLSQAIALADASAVAAKVSAGAVPGDATRAVTGGVAPKEG